MISFKHLEFSKDWAFAAAACRYLVVHAQTQHTKFKPEFEELVA